MWIFSFMTFCVQLTFYIYRMKYLTNSISRVNWEANGLSCVKKYHTFYGLGKFITYSREAATCPCPEPGHSSPCPETNLRSILTLSCNLCLGHLSLFPSGFPSKSLYGPLLSPIHATCPLYHVWLVDIHNMWWVQIIKVCIMQSSPVSSSLEGPNIFLSTLFSNTISLSVRDKVSLPHKATSKIMIACILIFIFLDSKLEDNESRPSGSRHSPWVQSARNFFMNAMLIC
jgi:hypothetical protein